MYLLPKCIVNSDVDCYFCACAKINLPCSRKYSTIQMEKGLETKYIPLQLITKKKHNNQNLHLMFVDNKNTAI